MKKLFIAGILIFFYFPSFSQKHSVTSPNKKIKVGLFNVQNANQGQWYLNVSYANGGEFSQVVQQIDLGLDRSDQDFAKDLKFIKASNARLINEEYTAVHGKRLNNKNSANEVIASFETPSKAKMNLIIRAYNDGVTFRYEFPESKGTFTVKDEFTAYSIAPETRQWLEKWNPANEGVYQEMSKDDVQQGEWCYPALFQAEDSTSWYLIHEADVDRNYCGTKLSNVADRSKFKATFPNPADGRGTGQVNPTINLPWKSPWRVIILGSLSDIVESTLVDDVSTPSKIKNTDWIKPGTVSWNYWSSNHGTRDYQVVTKFADLAANMNWPYTLLDWEWDKMENGGNLDDAIKYIHSKGVKPLIWYNSGGDHTWVPSTPKDRMLTEKNRNEEFTKLKKMGIAGVKVDFFESEKQDMIKYYLDIAEDAAKYEIMVYFHGCIVPRGWSRTYPNIMTYEAVKGAEWYNNIPTFTMEAPKHNTVLPFTRNVVGSMDYTPVTFTNSQFPHVTSYGHELALSVLFESALQHLADRPEGYYQLPGSVQAFLRDVPAAWDDIKLVGGYPGKYVTIARRKGDSWYIGGISAEYREKKQTLEFNYLPEGVKYKLTLLKDGKHDKEIESEYFVVDKTSKLEVKLLRRGGFAALLSPIE